MRVVKVGSCRSLRCLVDRLAIRGSRLSDNRRLPGGWRSHQKAANQREHTARDARCRGAEQQQEKRVAFLGPTLRDNIKKQVRKGGQGAQYTTRRAHRIANTTWLEQDEKTRPDGVQYSLGLCTALWRPRVARVRMPCAVYAVRAI